LLEVGVEGGGAHAASRAMEVVTVRIL